MKCRGRYCVAWKTPYSGGQTLNFGRLAVVRQQSYSYRSRSHRIGLLWPSPGPLQLEGLAESISVMVLLKFISVLAPANSPSSPATSGTGAWEGLWLEEGGKVCDMLVSSDSSSGNRPLSLSRCAGSNASAELQFAISDPTPGLQNSCPQDTFAVDLHLCLLTPSEWIWVSPLGWGGRAGPGGTGADPSFSWDGSGMLVETLLPSSCERGCAGGELVQMPMC